MFCMNEKRLVEFLETLHQNVAETAILGFEGVESAFFSKKSTE